MIEAFTTGSPLTNTIVITGEIESGFVANPDSISPVGDRFHSAAVQFSRAWHHSKRRRRWLGNKGSTCNGRSDPKCPSARRLRMVREDTGAPDVGATCAWMSSMKQLAVHVHFLRWGGLLDD
ncbi:uncharacterized protein TNCV_5076641 [Trichonephila clavipes]|uniref:Uncharacterized protein n=1 Tax=Trichonephila clavipes TaxID=2585209 RepID=A0A8X6S1G3_TRICX|nr:uncharacterized protein TNCV_5076641 [Trichonephila clavipes]